MFHNRESRIVCLSSIIWATCGGDPANRVAAELIASTFVGVFELSTGRTAISRKTRSITGTGETSAGTGNITVIGSRCDEYMSSGCNECQRGGENIRKNGLRNGDKTGA